eukprot:jgi/Mesen1/10426/ME000082S09931
MALKKISESGDGAEETAPLQRELPRGIVWKCVWVALLSILLAVALKYAHLALPEHAIFGRAGHQGAAQPLDSFVVPTHASKWAHRALTGLRMLSRLARRASFHVLGARGGAGALTGSDAWCPAHSAGQKGSLSGGRGGNTGAQAAPGIHEDGEERVGGGKEAAGEPGGDRRSLAVSLLWMAPFVSGGGYCSEAISYALALEASGQVKKLRIGQHGDGQNADFWHGLPEKTRGVLQRLSRAQVALSDAIVVCHSEPGAWSPPLYQTPPCPPGGYDEPLFTVGRTMFETDRVSARHVERCNCMDEVWVPTDFHLETFARSGVHQSKLVKVPQAVDTDFFDPASSARLPLPAGQAVFAPPLGPAGEHHTLPDKTCQVADSENGASASGAGVSRAAACPPAAGAEKGAVPFVFLSIFKWEVRKGWDILVKAYLQEFSADDSVTLCILTNAYHDDADFVRKLHAFVADAGLPSPPAGWPAVTVVGEHVPEEALPGLYGAADAFVLASRGEGWGRPVVEAMAMALPVIATNWSGMTEYLTSENAYPIPVERLSRVVAGPFEGHQWAEPSVEAVRVLLRQVFTCREEARSRGQRARRDMVRKYHPKVIGDRVMQALLRIEESVARKRFEAHDVPELAADAVLSST